MFSSEIFHLPTTRNQKTLPAAAAWVSNPATFELQIDAQPIELL
jgi:hypothetical protein